MSDPRPPDRRPLVERLRPTSLRAILGNPRAVSQLRDWAEEWDRAEGVPRRRAALLEGPPGVGKTTAALALAAERGWTVVEMNASDARNQSAIDEVAGRAALTNTLGSFGVYRGTREGGRTLILLDEADSLSGRSSEDRPRPRSSLSLREFLRTRYGSVEAMATAWGLGRPGAPPAFASWEDVPTTGGRGAWTRLAPAQRDVADWREGQTVHDASDRGGLGAIARLVRETRQPLILTVNDPSPLLRYSPVFRAAVLRVRFEPVRPLELKSFLRRIAVQEGYRIAGSALDRIVQRSQGDVRAALNDLEAVAPFPPGIDLDPILGGRDLSQDFYALTEDVLAHPRFYRSVEISNRIDAPPDDVLPWFEESVIRSPSGAVARAAAIDRLAVADRYLSWARRQRVYSLWSYATEIITGGTSLALGLPEGSRPPVAAFPQFLGAMGRSKAARATRLGLLGKAGARYHLSRRKARETMLPFFDPLFRGTRAARASRTALLRSSIVRSLGLSAEEVAYLMELEPDHPRVRELLAPAEAPPPEETAPPEPVEPAPPPAPPAAPPAPETKRKVQRRLPEF